MRKDETISPYAIAGLRRVDMPTSLKTVTANDILVAACEHFNLNISDLATRSRKRRFSYPRQCAIYLIRKHTTLTLLEIGSLFGSPNYDHTTIIHSNALIAGRLLVGDGNVKDDLDIIYNRAYYIEIIKGKSVNKIV